MKLRDLRIPILASLVAFVAGCGGSGVQATAPGSHEDLAGSAPEGGQYVLYRATGFDHAPSPTIERIWMVTAPRGEKLGFRWVTDENHRWDAFGANHLEAFAGGQVRDLGTFKDRDAKYLWANSNTDLTAYLRHADQHKTLEVISLQ